MCDAKTVLSFCTAAACQVLPNIRAVLDDPESDVVLRDRALRDFYAALLELHALAVVFQSSSRPFGSETPWAEEKVLLGLSAGRALEPFVKEFAEGNPRAYFFV